MKTVLLSSRQIRRQEWAPNHDEIRLFCRPFKRPLSKCYGTGFYNKELAEDAAKSLVASSNNKKVAKPGAFASDSRGGNYSVREAGKFSSLPLYDDYSDESSS